MNQNHYFRLIPTLNLRSKNPEPSSLGALPGSDKKPQLSVLWTRKSLKHIFNMPNLGYCKQRAVAAATC